MAEPTRECAPCPGIYEKILRGEKPDRIVWQNDRYRIGVIMARDLVAPAHVLVVPYDCHPLYDTLPPKVGAYLGVVNRHVGSLLMALFANNSDAQGRDRPAEIVSGTEISHVHIHRAFLDAGEGGIAWARWGRTEPFLQQSAEQRDAMLNTLQIGLTGVGGVAGEREAAMLADLGEEAKWLRVRGLEDPLPPSI